MVKYFGYLNFNQHLIQYPFPLSFTLLIVRLWLRILLTKVGDFFSISWNILLFFFNSPIRFASNRHIMQKSNGDIKFTNRRVITFYKKKPHKCGSSASSSAFRARSVSKGFSPLVPCSRHGLNTNHGQRGREYTGAQPHGGAGMR